MLIFNQVSILVMFAVGLCEWLVLTQGKDMWKLAVGKGGTAFSSSASLYWLKMIVKPYLKLQASGI